MTFGFRCGSWDPHCIRCIEVAYLDRACGDSGSNKLGVWAVLGTVQTLTYAQTGSGCAEDRTHKTVHCTLRLRKRHRPLALQRKLAGPQPNFTSLKGHSAVAGGGNGARRRFPHGAFINACQRQLRHGWCAICQLELVWSSQQLAGPLLSPTLSSKGRSQWVASPGRLFQKGMLRSSWQGKPKKGRGARHALDGRTGPGQVQGRLGSQRLGALSVCRSKSAEQLHSHQGPEHDCVP